MDWWIDVIFLFICMWASCLVCSLNLMCFLICFFFIISSIGTAAVVGSEESGCRLVESVPHYSLLHFLFSRVCVWETVSGHMAMPTAAVSAGYASLTSSANGEAGLGRRGTPARQLFGRTCFHSERMGPEAQTLLFFVLWQSVEAAPVQIFM